MKVEHPAVKVAHAGHVEFGSSLSSSPIVVGYSRLLLAIFGLAAIYFDESQPLRFHALAYAVLIGFVIYSATLMVLGPGGPRLRKAAVLLQAIDVVVFAFLALVTSDPTSPFLVYFTFALFSATLQWGWRGALWSALGTATCYWGIAALLPGYFAENIFYLLVRGGYQLVAGGLFAYFGRMIERQRERLAAVAAWPAPEPASLRREQPALGGMLDHLATLTGASGVAVAWNDPYEPHVHYASSVHGHRAHGSVSPALAPDGASDLLQGLPEDFRRKIDSQRAVVVAFDKDVSGVLVLVGLSAGDREIEAIAEIAAMQFSTEIVRDTLSRQSISVAEGEGWNQLARDVHDGPLQSLAAMTIRLRQMEADVPEEQRESISEVRGDLRAQQVALRTLLYRDRFQQTQSLAHLEDLLSNEIDMLAKEWHVDIRFEPKALLTQVDIRLAHSLLLFLREAVANGARHAKAKRFAVTSATEMGRISLAIVHDGKGLADWQGEAGHQEIMDKALGSASLRRRAELMGGRLSMKSTPSSLKVKVEVNTA
ncbi:MAG: sensor histidine kinase [Allorhizobium sp.]